MNRAISAIVLVLLILGSLAWWFGFRSEPVETAEARRGSIDVTIQTIGRVQSTGSTTATRADPGRG